MMRSRRGLGLALLAALTCVTPAAAQTLRNMQLMAHKNDFPPLPGGNGYASCWSYIHGDGREYAVIGCTNGTAIYNVTDPASTYLVEFITGPNSLWHEMKSYRNWIYAVSEGDTPGGGLQIISMVDPENPVLVNTYTTNFVTAHTVSVDTTRALLVVNGTRNGGPATGMRILTLASPGSPTNPVELSHWPIGGDPDFTDYVHDCMLVGNRLYAASIYVGTQRVLDITNPALPTVINSWTYPSAFYTHNAWPDVSQNYLYVTDEQNGQTMRVFDISNVMSPVLVNELTSNPAAIVHNAHVKGNELHLANYTEGIRILDITDPAHPAEFGYADSYPGPSGGFAGVWGVCPFFPSGTIIASDMNTGLYVYRPLYNYGVIRVQAIDAATQQPIPGVEVELSPTPQSLTTTADGVVVFAPDAGSYTVLGSKFGYLGDSEGVTLGGGVRDTVVLEMVKRPFVAYSGTVKSSANQAVLNDGDLELEDTPLSTKTNGSGQFSFPEVPVDPYTIEVHRPGYAPLSINRQIGPDGPVTQDLFMRPAALYDALEVASGWTVGATGDNASSGIWTRVNPVGTGSPAPIPPGPGYAQNDGTGLLMAGVGGRTEPAIVPSAPRAADQGIPKPAPELFHPDHGEGRAPGDAQPEDDRTPPPGVFCFITGQAANPNDLGGNDVDNGRTSLTTPALNMTGMVQPSIGYWRWFFNNVNDPSDWFVVLISNNNGTSFVPVDTTRTSHAHWHEQVIPVADYVTPTTQVKVRFQAADLGNQNIIEAGVDDLIVFDASLQPVDVDLGGAGGRIAFRSVWPNPSEGRVNLSLLSPGGRVEVEILDIQGRSVRDLYRGGSVPGSMALTWDGGRSDGSRAAAGLYFVRARAAGEEAVTRVVMAR